MEEVLNNVKGELRPIRQRELYAAFGINEAYIDIEAQENTNAMDSIQAIKNDLEVELLANHTRQSHNCILPSNRYKRWWDIYVMIILILVCILTPLNLAFDEEQKTADLAFETFIDLTFMVDIVLVFNSAYYDNKFKIVCDKKQIAKDYLGSWFVIDFLSCIPLQLLALTSFNNLIKFTKISKFYRVLKVARLTRVLKLFKSNSKLFRNL